MKDTIRRICKELESHKKIKILFAVENGSRAWRMASADSDYDVRMVFVRPIREYIQINRPGDVLEAAYDQEGNPHAQKGAVIDVAGFDVFKYVKMLSSSNPTTIEWLMTDIVYYGGQNVVFKEFAQNQFSPISLYHHYKSMCRNNYLKYLKSGSLVTYKKYLYAFRGLVNAKWVVNKKSVPPIVFVEALKQLSEHLPANVVNKLKDIIDHKAQGKEQDIVQNIQHMDSYIERFLKDDSEAPTEKSHATLNELNAELRRIIIS